MPYRPEHRDETRSRIVRSAQRLFNRHGFQGVSIDQIMAAAGLTRGGFYRHFSSKSDLYAEAMDCFFTNPQCGNRWEGVEVNPAQGEIGPQIVRAYLSRQHFQDIDDFLPDGRAAGRRGAQRRRGQAGLRDRAQRHDRASAARLGPDRPADADRGAGDRGALRRRHGHRPRQRGIALADEVREAARATSMALGGWRDPDS